MKNKIPKFIISTLMILAMVILAPPLAAILCILLLFKIFNGKTDNKLVRSVVIILTVISFIRISDYFIESKTYNEIKTGISRKFEKSENKIELEKIKAKIELEKQTEEGLTQMEKKIRKYATDYGVTTEKATEAYNLATQNIKEDEPDWFDKNWEIFENRFIYYILYKK